MYDFYQTALCWGNLHWLQALRDSETKRESAGLSHFSRVQLCVTLWTIARQASLSMGFSRQEYWSGLSCPSPGDLPNPRTEPTSLMSPVLAVRFFASSTTWEAQRAI